MKIHVRNIVLCGVLTALGVILGGPLSFNYLNVLKVSFAVVPAVVAGLTMGPPYGFAVGFLTDTATALLFPIGAYMPFFSITFGLAGILPSVCSPLFGRLMKKPAESYLPLLPSVLIGVVIGFTIGNTLLISLLYGRAFMVLLAARIFDLALVPAHAFFVAALTLAYRRVFGSTWVANRQ